MNVFNLFTRLGGKHASSRRPINLFLLLIFILPLLVSCQPKASGQVSFMVFGDTAELAAYQTLVDAFMAKYPEIDIELIHIPGQSDYRKRLAADVAAGTPANVVLINYRRYAAFAAKGALEPLAPYLAKSEVIAESDFYPQAIEPFYWNGQLMCIPQNLSSLVVYYNQDLFDQAGLPYPAAGWTWDDFLKAAQVLTLDSNGDGVMEQFGLGTEASLFRLAPFVWQNGAEIVDDPAAPTRLAIETPEALEAVNFFVDLSVKYHVVPNAEEEASQTSEDRFINGTLAMFLNSRRGVPTYRESANFNWDVAGLPQGKEQASILHSDAYCMTSPTEDKDAAWVFIEYANSVEGQTIISGTGRTVPSLISVAESPAFLDPNTRPASNQVFLDAIPYLRAVPILPNWGDIEEISGEEIERAFYGQASVNDAVIAAIRRAQPYFGFGE
ncbi:MAG TPA: sugar ABC transporter substrate-binding protein [Anaerolineales bacterium]|nr:sugar ABC transporter substrate-binding protein [Anaerolineales bacterium]